VGSFARILILFLVYLRNLYSRFLDYQPFVMGLSVSVFLFHYSYTYCRDRLLTTTLTGKCQEILKNTLRS
jgi:hypothetical protein